ncbi:DUF6507 family protein [Kocuria sp.]|uniref:DUF6507 family protein n=1 Tax=Kocuria sp. TaxID=1871328 RepID=UPI0026DFA531|nr:DUF6507 family protein [Kocuria sp.]MDO5619560.1 DUF6507 family protein [Kocuria sp.]
MQYDINLANAGTVLRDVETRSADYQDLADNMTSGLQRAAEGCQSEEIATALTNYGAEEFGPSLEAILNLTGTALTKTNEALTYYSEGNLAMMDESVKALGVAENAPTEFRHGGPTGQQAV